MTSVNDARQPWLSGAIRRVRSVDKPLAVMIAIFAVLLFGFVTLAEEVIDGDTIGFDARLLLALRTPGNLAQPIGPDWLQEMMRDFTALGSTGVLIIVTIGAVSFVALSGKRQSAALILASVVGGVILSSILKVGFARPRPEIVPHSVAVFTNSFPSGHAMMSAVVYLTLGELLARTQKQLSIKIFLMSFAVILAVLVGISRVYLGVHWPSDVLAGWAVGACWALLCWAVMVRMQARGQVEPESPASGPEASGGG